MFINAISAVLLDLGLSDVIANIPRDAGAVVVYILLGAFAFLVWHGSRSSTVDRYTAGLDQAESANMTAKGSSSGASSSAGESRPAA